VFNRLPGVGRGTISGWKRRGERNPGTVREVLKMKVRPIDERVLLKVMELEKKTSGGIIIPDTAKEKPQIGKVIAIGDDVISKDAERKPLSKVVKVGDRVLFAKYGGTEVEMEGEKLLLVNRNDILAVLDK
jgi:chaperonin GroES